MYKVQDKPDDVAILSNGVNLEPKVTLKDEYGGISHISTDDHCFVLYNGGADRPFEPVSHWYREAVEALIQYVADNRLEL